MKYSRSVEGKWDVLSSVMCDAAKKWLGYEGRQQPDWFRESEVVPICIKADSNGCLVSTEGIEVRERKE